MARLPLRISRSSILIIAISFLPRRPAPHITTWNGVSSLLPKNLVTRSSVLTGSVDAKNERTIQGLMDSKDRDAAVINARDAKTVRDTAAGSYSLPQVSQKTEHGYMVTPIKPAYKAAAAFNRTLPPLSPNKFPPLPRLIDTETIVKKTDENRDGTITVSLERTGEANAPNSTKRLLAFQSNNDDVDELEIHSGGHDILIKSSESDAAMKALLKSMLTTSGQNKDAKLMVHFTKPNVNQLIAELEKLDPVMSARFIPLFLCIPRLRLVFHTRLGGRVSIFIRPYFVASWAHCCNKDTSNFNRWGTKWYHDNSTNSCRQTNNMFAGSFSSRDICETRCCTASSPCSKDCKEPRAFVGVSATAPQGSWDYEGGKLIAMHGQQFWCAGRTCTCHDGVITCNPGTCAKRKNIRYTWESERTSLIDAMHWVKDGCPDSTDPDSSLPLATSKCISPDLGTPGWQLANFFEDHVAHSTTAHGNARFFPWHRKYLKEYESVLQQFNKCVMIPYWDWSQDSGNEDSIPWLSHCDPSVAGMGGTGCPSQAPSTHNDVWGKLGKGSDGGTDYPYGDGYGGMPGGRFRCDATQPLNTQWNLNSWTLGSSPAQNGLSGSYPCLFRNSRMDIAIPSSGTINSYMAATSYQQLMGFEGSPHGMPHVMIGGSTQDDWEPRGQMGDSRSPLDPMFWIHHAGVDKLWYDWQNADPANFNDYSYWGTESLTDKLGGTGQWEYNPVTGSSYKVQDVMDSAVDLEVCYQEGLVFYPLPFPYFKFLDLSVLLSAPAGDRGESDGRRSATAASDCYLSTTGKYSFVKKPNSINQNPYSCTWSNPISDPYACGVGDKIPADWCLENDPQYLCMRKINVTKLIETSKAVYGNFFLDAKKDNQGNVAKSSTPLFKYDKNAGTASRACSIKLGALNVQGEANVLVGSNNGTFALGTVFSKAVDYQAQQTQNRNDLVASGSHVLISPDNSGMPMNQVLTKCTDAKKFYHDKACCSKDSNGNIDYSKQSCCSIKVEEPVCCVLPGNKMITYTNECLLHTTQREVCLEIKLGMCPDTTSCKERKPVCATALDGTTKKTHANYCLARLGGYSASQIDQSGACPKQPCTSLCGTLQTGKAPVCSGGKSFPSAECAKCLGHPTPGPCGCVCTKEYRPVCHTPTQTTHSNKCMAVCYLTEKKLPVKDLTPGACYPSNGMPDDTADTKGDNLPASRNPQIPETVFRDIMQNAFNPPQDVTSLPVSFVVPKDAEYAFSNSPANMLPKTTPFTMPPHTELSIESESPTEALLTCQKAEASTSPHLQKLLNCNTANFKVKQRTQKNDWKNDDFLTSKIHRISVNIDLKQGNSRSKSPHDSRRGIVLPIDERVSVSTTGVEKTPWAQVGCISYLTSAGNAPDSTNNNAWRQPRCSCTGTWVSERHLLTAGHCLSDNQNWLGVYKVYAHPFNGNSIDNGNVASFAWKRMTTVRGWFDDENREYDYGLIEVYKGKEPNDPITKETYFPGNVYGWRSFGYNQNIGLNYWFNLAGYPADKRPVGGTIGGQNWRTAPWMWRDFNSTYQGEDAVQDKLIYHIMDTRGGQSGAGAYLYNGETGSRVIYSVHRGWSGLTGDTALDTTYNVATRINAFRFGQICDWISRSGAPAVC